jgi:starch synthase (maltosyl-transferring)
MKAHDKDLTKDLCLHRRVIIEKVQPQIDCGKFPIKRVRGETVVVRANVFGDGHDEVYANLLYRTVDESEWHEVPMKPLGNDLWAGSFTIQTEKEYRYTVRGYMHGFASWRVDLKKKFDALQDIKVDLMIGADIVARTAENAEAVDKPVLKRFAEMLHKVTDQNEGFNIAWDAGLLAAVERNLDISKSVTYEPELKVNVERQLALFSSWYELFPRSCSPEPGKHGTFKDCERLLPEISEMGFDIVYFPPIHPIGTTFRKGKNNSKVAGPGDPGSPWAIGSPEGGHKAVHTELGTLADLRSFINKTRSYGMEVALDIAYQCSNDHPYIKAHPEWFKWRPDGTIQHAENPPKKYEDVVPINFESDDAPALWQEMKDIILFWVEQGVKIFRVDNPHTKPFYFWDWMIEEVRARHPDVIFLAEAFTRPNVMYRLAKGGFTQSYTYFTWRNSKWEFTEYMNELTRTEAAEFMRPNFWPNTPDILAEHLQYGGRPEFITRAVLAATLSSNWGIYGPAYELCVNEAVPGKEEYINSEKYEIKNWDRNAAGNIKDVITQLNRARRDNTALQMTRNIRFCDIGNDQLIAYYKATADYSNIILVVVNLDPYHVQSGFLKVPLQEIGLEWDKPYLARDMLSGENYIWQGESNYIQLDPYKMPAHILQINKHLHREQEFDFYL